MSGDHGDDWTEELERAQSLRWYELDGVRLARLPYGTETFREVGDVTAGPCRHCGTRGGDLHDPGCNYEQCPFCGGQVLSCDCDPEPASMAS